MKRIAIDINSVLPLYSEGWISGIGRTTKELVEALDKMDNLPFEVVLYSQNTKGISGKQLGLSFTNKHICFPHKDWANKIIKNFRVREYATRYDLLHIPHNFEWVAKPQKTVVTIHDAMYFSYPDDVFNYKYYQSLYPTLAKRCKGIITCSEASKRDIMQYMGIAEDKIFVCPWGYRDDLFYPRQDKKAVQPFFLTVSCSTGRKNTMSVIRAYEKLVKQNPQHKLVLVWPKAPQTVIDYCNQPHLRNHIQIAKDVDDEQLSILYNEATATFFPSRYEGFGLPILESMACGTPVVTCPNSSLPEVGGEAALYVAPDDIDAMCNYMAEFEQGNLTKSNLTLQCLEQASKFSWKRCATQTIEAYQKCL